MSNHDNLQNPPVSDPDTWAIADDLVRHLRERWSGASEWQQAEALLVALYGIGGPLIGASVLAHSIPTLPNK